MEIQFTIPMIPVAKGRPRFRMIKNKFAIAYTPKKTKDAEDQIRRLAMPYKPKSIIVDPIHLVLSFWMPVPKGTSKKKRYSMRFHSKRPDLDNLEKLIMDALTGTFWKDDSLIWSKKTVKMYSDNPGILVDICY